MVDQDQDQEYITRVLDKSLPRQGSDENLKYEYQVLGSDRILLSCSDVHLSMTFQEMRQPVLDLEENEEEEERQESPPAPDDQEAQQRTEDESTVSGVEQESPLILTELHVKSAIDSIIHTSRRIKTTHFVEQFGSNYEMLFGSFSTETYKFELDPATEEMVFKRRTLDPPLRFITSLLSPDPSSVSADQRPQIYTRIKPYARSWINKKENDQRYIQLMGLVRYGWKNLVPGMEPTRVDVSVHSETQGSCWLQMESIPTSGRFGITDKLELTTGRLRDKGITFNSQIQAGGGLNGGNITTPSLILNYMVQNQDQLKKVDIEVRKIEFEDSLRCDDESVKWFMKRMYSRMKDPNLNRIDLTMYDPSQILSSKEVAKIKWEDSIEPISDYVNFGVWKWDGKPVTFVFEVEHGYRRLIKTKARFPHVHPKYITKEENFKAGKEQFKIELKFK